MSIAQLEDTKRMIGSIEKDRGPILLLVAGIHGNEPAGIQALNEMMLQLSNMREKINGSVYAILGNMKALQQNTRYIDTDLNRMWSPDVKLEDIMDLSEYEEYQEIKDIISVIKSKQNERPLILLDLHTTSAESLPFILCSNEPRNRRLVIPIPAPTILGVENRIKGTLMNYLNDMGDAAIVFEAGSHSDPASVTYHKSIIQLLLVGTGLMNQCDLEDFESIVNNLYHHSIHMQYVFEIIFRYGIKPGEKFKMRPGFQNFMKIEQGTALADNENGVIVAPLPGRIFMPLYQDKGNDGFFIINEGKS
ncbi:MAG: succinylglutamate desuccinylase/aspartoacylase family protein [Bacteroidetes bacterium]|nr:succinylglutamate desuccinylase/aspartoacylase family protein [Bacteroidota bacterium]